MTQRTASIIPSLILRPLLASWDQWTSLYQLHNPPQKIFHLWVKVNITGREVQSKCRTPTGWGEVTDRGICYLFQKRRSSGLAKDEASPLAKEMIQWADEVQQHQCGHLYLFSEGWVKIDSYTYETLQKAASKTYFSQAENSLVWVKCNHFLSAVTMM